MRLFTFGCSFTEYDWPTWADLIGHTLHQDGYEYYNFGLAGTGNYYILASMIKANNDFKFTDTDIIMVMWSSWTREDRLLPNNNNTVGWTNAGNLLNSSFYTQHFIEKYWSMDHDIIKNITCITAAQAMFNINWEGHLPGYENAGSTRSGGQWLARSLSSLSDNDALLSLLSKMQLKNTFPYRSTTGLVTGSAEWREHHWDGHPLPNDYCDYIRNVISPQTGIQLHPDTIEFAREWHARSLNSFEVGANEVHCHQIQHKQSKIWRRFATTYRHDIFSNLWYGTQDQETHNSNLVDFFSSWIENQNR